MLLVVQGFSYTHHISLFMITSTKHSRWYGDHKIINLQETGLTAPSIIRQKLFTIDMRLVKKQVGNLANVDREAVVNIMQQHINFSSSW